MIMKIEHEYRKLASIWNQNIGLLKRFKEKSFGEKSLSHIPWKCSLRPL